jgi:hypothetical protein
MRCVPPAALTRHGFMVAGRSLHASPSPDARQNSDQRKRSPVRATLSAGGEKGTRCHYVPAAFKRWCRSVPWYFTSIKISREIDGAEAEWSMDGMELTRMQRRALFRLQSSESSSRLLLTASSLARLTVAGLAKDPVSSFLHSTHDADAWSRTGVSSTHEEVQCILTDRLNCCILLKGWNAGFFLVSLSDRLHWKAWTLIPTFRVRSSSWSNLTRTTHSS